MNWDEFWAYLRLIQARRAYETATGQPHFLTNTDPGNVELILEAADETDASIFIGESSNDFKDWVGVYTWDRQDKSDFWRRYRELKEEVEAPEKPPAWWPEGL